MGRLTLNDVVQRLEEAGMAVERGFPAGKLMTITEPVCAVNLLKADLRAQTLTAQITVLSPAELGAAVCEDAALGAARLLSDQSYDCTLEACELNGRTGLFEMKMTARFSTDLYRITLGTLELHYAVSFTYWRELKTGVTDLEEVPWSFRLEEFFPTEAPEGDDPEVPFNLLHVTSKGLSTFFNCNWTSWKRSWSPAGIQQIREGTSDYMELS